MDVNKQKLLKTLTLLYIEDEDAIRQSMTDTLQMFFKDVFSFENAEDAYEYYTNNHVDIIISDINLPNMSGIEFTKIVRKENFQIPIILLTAYSQTSTLLEATRLKLVNYITKPIIYEDLYDSLSLAVEEILRFQNKVLRFDNNITYNISTKLLFKNHKEIHLTSSENRLLEVLVDGLPKTVNTNKIKEKLWDNQDDATDSALKSVLTKLRSKIGKQHIKNVSGMGYYLVVDLGIE